METNFLQTGEGHCWICHKTYYQEHTCTLETTFPTPCNPVTCGRWYDERQKSELKIIN